MTALVVLGIVTSVLSIAPAYAVDPFNPPEVDEASERLAGPVLKKVAANALPDMTPEGDLAGLERSIRLHVETCKKQSGTEAWDFGGRKVSRTRWCVMTGQAFLKLIEEERDFGRVLARARNEFDWYQSTGRDGQGEVMFTGYYFPTLRGQRKASAQYSYPLYKRPLDLVQVVLGGSKVWRRKLGNGRYTMYADRRGIDVGGFLRGKGLEIAHVDDPFGAFILHVQGSGQVLIDNPDGSQKRVITNYAAQNGHSYVSIRQVLQDMGVDPSYFSLQGMRRYFNENPSQLMPVLLKNPSYVFFKEATEGPFGSAGVQLTSGHSVAVDYRIFPMGALMLFHTQRPIMDATGGVGGWQEFSRFAVTQDTGGAIRGAGRVDVYWGGDSYAELAAGQMNHLGRFFIPIAK